MGAYSTLVAQARLREEACEHSLACVQAGATDLYMKAVYDTRQGRAELLTNALSLRNELNELIAELEKEVSDETEKPSIL